MTKIAFKMTLKPGFEKEYQRRHDEIWPELSAELKRAGISDYSIFLDDETHTLFAVQRIDEANTASQLPEQEIVKKWWAHMADIMETHKDNSPICGPLRQVFHLD